MSHTSPASYLVWAILSCLLGAFLLFHLWSFDRFKCLKWNNGPYSGAFKRVMTYSYLISIPLLMTYSVGFATIKYIEGFMFVEGYGIIPVPWQLWSPLSQSAILPLYLVFSAAWSLEMVTHLEELCFWLFLVNAGSAQQDWFQSLYFKTWAFGSVLAVAYMPLVTIFTRSDPLKCEAYTFLAGSLGSLSLTIWFTPILWTFPSFLSNLRREGVDTSTVVRLTKFHELNTLRVLFRFLFTAPLLILAVDGIRPHQHINEKMVWTDLLAMIAAFGCVISSAITLVIFFPRSIEGEIAVRETAKERRRNASYSRNKSQNLSMVETQVSQSYSQGHSHGHLIPPTSPKDRYSYPSEAGYEGATPLSQKEIWLNEEDPDAMPLPAIPLRPNRRKGQDAELGGVAGTLTEGNLSKHNLRMSNVNVMVHNFTSPIDLAYGSYNDVAQPAAGSRFTFARR